jgi:Ca2+-binding RTX toxin-like protein
MSAGKHNLVDAKNSILKNVFNRDRKQTRKKDRRRRLTLEGLERREMMAADITLTSIGLTAEFFDSGRLQINGTSVADEISVHQVNDRISVGGNIWIKTPTGFVSSLPVTSVKSLSISGNGGNDTILLNTETLAGHQPLRIPATIHGGSGDDTIVGTAADDTIHGGSNVDRIWGGGGADRIFGGSEVDYLDGGDGRDHIEGGSGNDYIYGGRHSDVLIGGAGNDRLLGDEGDDQYLYMVGRQGHDTVWDSIGTNLLDFGHMSRGASIDLAHTGTQVVNSDLTLTLANARAIQHVDGTDFDDRIWGNDQKNSLRGRGGDDTIYGRGGDDRLTGGSDNDRISGGAGADYIRGGTGVDTLLDEIVIDKPWVEVNQYPHKSGSHERLVHFTVPEGYRLTRHKLVATRSDGGAILATPAQVVYDKVKKSSAINFKVYMTTGKDRAHYHGFVRLTFSPAGDDAVT